MTRQIPVKRAVNLQSVNPFECKMWLGHNRMLDLVSEETCRDEIASFRRDGQKQPVLGRTITASHSRHRIELIYGARRLFVAQHLNVDLLVDVQTLTDEQAFVEMDIENRLRRRVSAYEQGMAYKEWLRAGYFKSQHEVAETLGISTAQVSRLMKFAELPAALMAAFRSQTDIKEGWAVTLAQRCEDRDTREAMLRVARSIASHSEDLSPSKIFKLLLDCKERRRRARLTQTDTIVRSEHGEPLFRISYREMDIHIIVRREIATTSTVGKLSTILQGVLEQCCSMERSNGLKNEGKLEEFGGLTAPARDGRAAAQLPRTVGAPRQEPRL